MRCQVVRFKVSILIPRVQVGLSRSQVQSFNFDFKNARWNPPSNCCFHRCTSALFEHGIFSKDDAEAQCMVRLSFG